MSDVTVVVGCKNILGEGPLWDVARQRLCWTVPARIGSLAIRDSGRSAIVSLQAGFHLLDLDTGECTLLHDPEPHLPRTRINDGEVDRKGRFNAGSMDSNEKEPNGALYRVDTGGSVHVLERGIICSNGPCWSPNSDTFYFTDTWSVEISVYDHDHDQATGTPGNKRRFASFEATGGAPDRATIDAQGCLWSEAVHAGIVRFSPDGAVDRGVEMPVLTVTSVAFGGPELDIHYVNSMASPPLPRFPEDGPMAGHLFAVHGLGVRGIPELRFGG